MNLIHYLLEANLYLLAFYLLYLLLLRSETLYQLNRAYLLVSSLMAFIIPLLQLGILKPEAKPIVSIGAPTTFDEPLTATAQALPTIIQTAPKWTITDYALAIYATVTLALLMYLAFKIIKLIALSKKGVAQQHDGFTVIEIPGPNVAFSFFRYLFVNTELLSSPTILRHEEVHIRQKHSWDVIYMELLKCINWFNPVVYLLQKSLKEVHEFIADQQVANAENGAAHYADFLISNAYGLTPIQLTNSFFNKNLLKRRIIMLYQKKSGRVAKLKYLVALPLLGGLLCLSTMAFTNKNYGWLDLMPHAMIVNPIVLHQATYNTAPGEQANINREDEPDPVYNVVDHQPVFPGGEKGFTDFLIKNVKYPAAAKEARITGKAYVRFVIEKDGSVSDIQIVREPGMGLGDEAVRVLKLSPKWKPGTQNGKTVRVQFTVPINFALADNKPAISGQTVPPVVNSPDASATKTPIKADTLYNAVEVQPTFPGGLGEFENFLSHTIVYPAVAKAHGIQGRAFVQFTVEKDGSLSSLKVLRDPGAGLGDEAVRALSLSPKWKAGIQNGKNVRVQYTVPVSFALTDADLKAAIKPIVNPDVAASFPGGQDAFAKFLIDNVKYPSNAKINGVAGRVVINFIVQPDGSLTDMKVMTAPRTDLGNEGIRVMRLSPKWLPATNNGQTVSSEYSVPINFALDDTYKKDAFKDFYKQVMDVAKYPAEAKQNDISGREIVAFTVNANKQPENIRIIRGVDKLLDEEVIRILQKCNVADAKPGLTYVLPIFFGLNGQTSEKPSRASARISTYSRLNDPNAISLNEVAITGYK